MRIERRYTKEGQSAYADIAFRLTASEIRNPDGSVVFRAEDVEVPAFWSQVAADVLAQKYFPQGRPAGAAEEGRGANRSVLAVALGRRYGGVEQLPERERSVGEHSSKQVFERLRRHLDLLGLEGQLFRHRDGCPRVFRRARLHAGRPDGRAQFTAMVQYRPVLAYGIDGPSQGHFLRRLPDRQLVKSKSAYEHPQPHACFIQSIKDDLVNEGGIMDLWLREARLFQIRLRHRHEFLQAARDGEKLAGGGRSSGLMSFSDRRPRGRRDQIRRHHPARPQDGDRRYRPPRHRAVHHWKVTEEQKVANLVTGSKINQRHLRAVIKSLRELRRLGR